MRAERNKRVKGICLVVILMLITVFSKVLGLARETMLAYFYGTSGIIDIFVLATSVPKVLFGCLDAVAVTIVPIYIKRKKTYSQENANKAINNIISWTFIVSVMVLFITELLCPRIVNLFDVGHYENRNLLIFLRITLFTVVFNPMAQIYLSLSRCDGKQIKAQIFELFISGVQIIFIVASGLMLKPILLPLGYLLSILVCYFCSYCNTNNKFVIDLTRGETLKEAVRLVIPAFWGSTIIQINALIDKIFASTLVAGMVSALNYANIVKNLFYALFTAPMINIYYPRITASISVKDYKQTRKEVSDVLSFMLLFLVPSTYFCLFFSDEIMKLFFFRGAFNIDSLEITSAAFRMYAIGIIAICLREVFVRCYYALNKTKEIIWINIISVIINIVLNATLIESFEQAGLALATSLSAILVLPFWIRGASKEYIIRAKKLFFLILKYIIF